MPDLRELKTYRYDTLRQTCDGVYHTLSQTVIMLVAVKLFNLPDGQKSVIASAAFVGNLLTLPYASLAGRTAWRKSTLAAAPVLLSGLFILAAAFVSSPAAYAAATAVSLTLFSVKLPFITGIYSENYPAAVRGVRFSSALTSMVISSFVANYLFGKALDFDLSFYRLIFGIAFLFVLLSAFFLYRIPSTAAVPQKGFNPLAHLSMLYRRPLFGYMCFVWFIFGAANLGVNPLMVVYLGEAGRGLNLSPLMVALILGVIPNGTRLLFTKFWGRRFDRSNFIGMRITLNSLMGVGLMLFFLTRSVPVICLGVFLWGLGFAGGNVMWNLWVTKFVPPSETQAAMSVHTFLTGVRGVLSPSLGFLYIANYPIHQVGMISFGMNLVSIALLIPLLKMGRRMKEENTEPAEAVVL